MTKRIRVRRRDLDGKTYSVTIRGARLTQLWDRLPVGGFFPLLDALHGEILEVSKSAGGKHDATLFGPINDDWQAELGQTDYADADDFAQLLLASESEIAR